MASPSRAIPLVAVLLVSSIAVGQPEGTGRLTGVVYTAPNRAAAAVRVLLVPQRGGVVREATTDRSGRYRFEALPHGHYRCVIIAGERAYPGNRILLVPPGKKIEADWTLGGVTERDRLMGLGEGQPVPEAGGVAAAGVAHLREKLGPTGLRWLTSGRGALVLLGGATAIVALVIALTGNEPSVSRSSP